MRFGVLSKLALCLALFCSGCSAHAFDAQCGEPPTQDNNDGDFIIESLRVGEVVPLRWKDTGEIVHEYAFEVGLGDEVSEKLLKYCHHRGISRLMEGLTQGAGALNPSDYAWIEFGNESFAVERPTDWYNSNLHWVDFDFEENVDEEWFQALSAVGFDQVLAGMGESLGLDSLFSFYSTFIGVSYGGEGSLHDDVCNTDGKVFNMIIPLISPVNETDPELDIQDSTRKVYGSDDLMIGRYKYRNDVAILLGDGVMHATRPHDFRSHNGFRMAASIYWADINLNNIDRIADNDSGHYNVLDADWILENAGTHWKRGDSSTKLPAPNENHVLLNAN